MILKRKYGHDLERKKEQKTGERRLEWSPSLKFQAVALTKKKVNGVWFFLWKILYN